MKKHPATYSRLCRRAQRRGVVLIVVIVTTSISLVLFGIWARNMVKEHRRFANQQYRLQATRLAEAGIRRAMARKSAEPQFQEETWTVPAESLGGTHAANVQIRAMPSDNAATVRYEATAQFPAGAARRAQITKRIEVPIPPSENES
jgi:Tfp pilus assembly protein PilX